jgi:hypothetical protein
MSAGQENTTPCSNHSHFLVIRDTDAERCPTCGRRLWRKSPQKCSRHGVWFCAEGCFTEAQLRELKGILHEDKTEN